MYPRYKLRAYLDDQLIYSKKFKSLNNLIKCAAGFDSTINFEAEDEVFEKVIYDWELKNYIHELCSLESEDY